MKFKGKYLIVRTSPYNKLVRVIKKIGGAGYWVSDWPAGAVVNLDSRIVDKLYILYTDIFFV